MFRLKAQHDRHRQHDVKDQDMMSRHSEALAEESHNYLRHSEGVLQSKTTEESNRDVSLTLNMTS